MTSGYDLLNTDPLPANAVVRTSNLDDLPPPMQRYFQHVLRDGQALVETARIEQSGTVRSNPTGNWAPFTATQHVAVRPPGFV